MTMLSAEFLRGFKAAYSTGQWPAPGRRGVANDQMPENGIREPRLGFGRDQGERHERLRKHLEELGLPPQKIEEFFQLFEAGADEDPNITTSLGSVGKGLPNPAAERPARDSRQAMDRAPATRNRDRASFERLFPEVARVRVGDF
jgi:hypothetical protein